MKFRSFISHAHQSSISKVYAQALGLSQRVGSNQARNRIERQLRIREGVPGHHRLIQVRVEGHPLHVVAGAHLDEGLPGRVGPVEQLLQDIQHLVGAPVLLVKLVQVDSEVPLPDHVLALLGALDDGLGRHAPGLGGEVDALPGALGHVAGGVSYQCDSTCRVYYKGYLYYVLDIL